MKGITLVIFAAIVFVAPLSAKANECWLASNIKGYSAYADESYEFAKDGLPSTVLVCFEGDRGTVSGTDTRLVKFGESTLAGYAENKGIELFEVYQLDKIKNKILYIKSRIGTKTVTPILSDVVTSFVGDIVKVNN